MLSKNQIKYVHSLKLPKFREEHGEFVAEGVKLIGELLESSWTISRIFAIPEWISRNIEKIREKEIDCQEVEENELERLSHQSNPNQVLATVRIPLTDPEKMQIPESKVLLLDRIQDPGNLGSIIRTADWFGIRTIICSPHTADIYNPKVIQSSMGSFIRVGIYYMDPTVFLKRLPASRKVYGTMAEGENIYHLELARDAVIIIGNESKGISEYLFPYITQKIGIPGAVAGAESLNASVAAAIICSEFNRQSMEQ